MTAIRFQVSRFVPPGYLHLPKRKKRAPKNEFRNDGIDIPLPWEDITPDVVRQAIKSRYPGWILEGYCEAQPSKEAAR